MWRDPTPRVRLSSDERHSFCGQQKIVTQQHAMPTTVSPVRRHRVLLSLQGHNPSVRTVQGSCKKCRPYSLEPCTVLTEGLGLPFKTLLQALPERVSCLSKPRFGPCRSVWQNERRGQREETEWCFLPRCPRRVWSCRRARSYFFFERSSTRMLRNFSPAPWPQKPMCPVLLNIPGWLRWSTV